MAMTTAHFETGEASVRQRVRMPGKFLVLGVVLVAALGGAIWFLIERESSLPRTVDIRTTAAGHAVAYIALPELLVDLAPDRNGRTAYLKMTAVLALPGDEARWIVNAFDVKEPLIVERLTFFLRELRPEDFASTEGMERVKSEMARRVNLVIAPTVSQDVIIQELVIQ